MSKNSPLSSGDFLRFSLRLEKIKETKIYRTYLNLAVVIANIGGILKVISMVFLFISMLVSTQLLNLKLINDTFLFEGDVSMSTNEKNGNNKKMTKR